MQVTGTGEKRVLKFEWREHGLAGLKDPQHTGFGVELLSRILPYDLGADTSVDFAPKGLRFSMTLPGKHIADGVTG